MDIDDDDNGCIYERKYSTQTLNTDSGVSCSTCYSDDMTDIDPAADQVQFRSGRCSGRISMDETNGRTSGEFTKLIESSGVRSRISRSLPDILDIDSLSGDFQEESSHDLNRTEASSDLNVSFEDLDDTPSMGSGQRQYGRGSVLPVQVCGKEHVEDPCYICMKDNEIYCSVCVQVHNFHCREEVRYIPDIPPATRVKFCADTVRDLQIMKRRFTKIKQENQDALVRLKDSKKSFVCSVMAYKSQIIQAADRIEREALQELDSIFGEESRRIEANLEYIERELVHLDSYLQILELESCSWENGLVFELQEATKQVQTDESVIRDCHKSANFVELTFEPAEALLDMLQNVEELWNVARSETECCLFPAPCCCDKPYQYKVAEKDREASVRLMGFSFDREKCCITGCEFLPNGKLLVCDNSNKKVKLFDKKFKCISAQSLPSLPWDLAVTGSSQAVVTIPDRKQLQFIETQHRKIALKQSVKLDRNCWGVSCNGNRIFITCWSRDSSEVVVLSMDGKIQRCIKAVGGNLFHTPWFLDSFNGSVYVSDWGTYVVQCMDEKGLAVAKYRNTSLVGPIGVTHDPDGNVYVCGRDSNTVHQLSPAGTLQQVILTEKHGIQQPLNICHRPSDDILVVTSWMSDRISVYKLS